MGLVFYRRRGAEPQGLVEMGAGVGQGLGRVGFFSAPPDRNAEGNGRNRRGSISPSFEFRRADCRMPPWSHGDGKARALGVGAKGARTRGCETALQQPNFEWLAIDGCRPTPLRRIASACDKGHGERPGRQQMQRRTRAVAHAEIKKGAKRSRRRSGVILAALARMPRPQVVPASDPLPTAPKRKDL